MKKRFLAVLATGLLAGMGSVAQADTLIADIDGVYATQYSLWWDEPATVGFDNDTNPDWLINSNPVGEETWLEAVLGLVYDDPSVNLIDKLEDPEDVTFGDINTNPFIYDFGKDWEFAVVKIGQGQDDFDHFAIRNDGDYLLSFDFTSFGEGLNGVSHIGFYGGEPGNEIPEPTTMLLFGTGLVGLAGVARRRNKK